MQNYAVRANRDTQIIKMLAFKEGAQTVTFDYSPWADDNGNVSSVVPTLKTGEAGISNESLVSNLKTLVITTSEYGHSLIRLAATAGNNIHIINLYVLAKDPQARVHDYGLMI